MNIGPEAKTGAINQDLFTVRVDGRNVTVLHLDNSDAHSPKYREGLVDLIISLHPEYPGSYGDKRTLPSAHITKLLGTPTPEDKATLTASLHKGTTSRGATIEARVGQFLQGRPMSAALVDARNIDPIGTYLLMIAELPS